MRRAISIFIFILILTLRQTPSALIVDHMPGSRSILQEANFFIGTQGLGLFEGMENGDPGVLSPVFKAFQNEEQWFIGEAALRHSRYLFHCFTNPLLIDRPPPAMGAGYTAA